MAPGVYYGQVLRILLSGSRMVLRIPKDRSRAIGALVAGTERMKK